MTKNEVRQQKKNEALNAIRKIYNHKYQFHYDEYDDASGSEQREDRIQYIIEQLEKELKQL